MSKHDPKLYVRREEYTVLLNAFNMACDFIKENKFTVTKQNDKVLPYLAHDTLIGYFIMEARNELKNEKERMDT